MAATVFPKLKDRMHEKQNRYIYHLPYSITRQIAQNLDIDNAWQHLAAEIGYTHQQVRIFEMEQKRPGVSPTQQMLTDWQAKNPTAQDLHDKLHKINRRREMQILEAWFTSESGDTQSFFSPKKVNSNDDRTASQIQAALDNFDSKSLKPPGKGQNRKTSPPKVEDVNVNLNRCDTFKDKMEMGSKHLDGGLISKPSMKKQMSKEVESEDKTIMHEVGVSGPGKSMDNMASNTALRQRLQNNKSSSGYQKSKDIDDGSSSYHKSKDNDVDYSIALNGIHGFSYKEIVQATNGFSDEYLIGQGAYGKVFHAVLKNTKCAVKKLFSREDVNGNIEQQVKRELATLSKYRHNNIVLLYGYMIDQPDVSMADVCLVYQLMPNGSLEDRIACKNNTPALTWKQRLGILRGAACGLQYLLQYQEPIPCEQLVSTLCDIKQAYTQFGGKRPFGVSLLYVGWDKHYGFQLYQSDPSGNYGGWKATCIGNNSANAVSMLKQEYKEGEVKLKDALNLAIKILSKTLDMTKLTAEKVEIATLTRVNNKTQITILPAAQVEDLIKIHEAEEAKVEAEKKKEKS
ncbi:Hypothetical predicted protein [Mytilus galloprovincialis]|uniref:Uncharacterized protein n=1 Tax=Mytilus galloprovincialis TaxID=29158 RepID=A0A8B6EPY7_MYTGA|nr:Hypothetical predicted protein [Mytilus galloprovincialis]